MGSRERDAGIRDRISTRQELGQAIIELIELHQLSFDATLESLESSEDRYQDHDLELWTDSDPDGLRGTEIVILSNIILGRKQPSN